MGQIRAGRMAGEIQKEIADILANQLKDPRLGFVSVLAVDAAPDLSAAKVHISCWDDDASGTMAALESAKGFIRRELGKRLRVRVVPELHFELNHSIAYGVRMIQAIDQQIEADEKAAAQRQQEPKAPGEEEK